MARRDTGNRTTYWQSKRIAGMSLLRADFAAQQFSPHTHDAFVIAVTEAGGAEISSRGITEKVSRATLFVSNPEESQSARMDEGERWRYRAFYLTRPAIDAVGRSLGIKAAPYFMRNMLRDADLIEKFGRLHQVLETNGDDSCADEFAVDAFSHLFHRYGSGGQPEPAPACRAIAPHAYLIHIRLNAACRLLKRGVTLAESALAAGFCDQSALTRHFKRCYGITPRQFAAAARAG